MTHVTGENGLIARFHRQVATDAQAIALSDTEGSLTYLQLWEQAERLAGALIRCGVQPGDVVGLACGRTRELVLTMIAVLCAGGVVMPLDTASPAARLANVMADSGCRWIASAGEAMNNNADWAQDIPVLDVAHLLQHASPILVALPSPSPDDPAFLFYTSGSTGQPKGVEVLQAGVLRLALAPGIVPLQPGDRYGCASNPAFDAISFEIWCPLLTGGQICVLPDAVLQDPKALATWLVAKQIDILFMTVALFNEIADQYPTCFAGLKHLLIGGAAVNANAVQAWYRANPTSQCLIHNGYGPTEATTFSLYFTIPHDFSGASVPIGRPLPQTGIRVIRTDGRHAATDEVGELQISGAGLARGYRNRPLETERSFVTDRQSGIRYYRTGDLAKINAAGLVEYCGRIDRQVKIRGFRVEPEEVEAQISRHPAVAEVHVCMRRHATGRNELLAFIALSEPMLYEDFSKHLAQTLPPYMHPHATFLLPTLPKTRNGKMDEAAMLAMVTAPWRPTRQDQSGLSPWEGRLIAMVQDLLECSDLVPEDSFLDAGGDSILALRLAMRIEEQWHIRPSPIDCLTQSFTTLANWCAIQPATQERGPVAAHETQKYAPMTDEQLRLWLMSQRQPDSCAYNVPLIFHVDGSVDVARLNRAVAELCDKHPALRTAFVDTATGQQQQIEPKPLAAFTAHPPGAYTETTWRNYAAALFSQRFNLAVAGSFQLHWLPFDVTRGVLLMHMHHIVVDGWSVTVLLEDLGRLYSGTDAISSPAPSPISFAGLQKQLQMDPGYQADLTQSKALLHTELHGAALLAMPAQADPEAQVIWHRLPDRLGALITTAARAHKITRFQLLQAVFGWVFSTITGMERFAVAAPVANRSIDGFARSVGMFANTVIIPTHIVTNMTIADYIAQQGGRSRAMLRLQHVLLSDLSPTLQRIFPKSERWFDAMFVMETTDYDALDLGGAKATVDFPSNCHAKCPVVLTALDHGRAFDLIWEVQTAKFNTREGEALHSTFCRAIELLADPSQTVASLTVSGDNFVATLQGPSAQPLFSWVIDGFERQAHATPDAIALVHRGQSLSYKALSLWADSFAASLAEHPALAGYDQGGPLCVALQMDAGSTHIMALLALARLNITALPLDATYPIALQSQVLSLAKPALILIEADGPDVPQDGVTPILTVRGPPDTPRASPPTRYGSRALYLLFTSGSTGVPKGVEVSNAALCNLICWQHADGKPALATQQFSKLSFDVSFQEIFATLCFGGVFHTITAQQRQDLPALLNQMRAAQIGRVFMPMVAVQLLAETALAEGITLPALREVITAGEQLVCTRAIRSWFAGMSSPTLWNQYGPTETHVLSAHRLAGDPLSWPEIAPIGLPVANAKLVVSDDSDKPLGWGKIGHLLAAGPMVAACYLEDAQLNRDRFLHLPDENGEAVLWYRTGDLALVDMDGLLHWMGRADDQVKVSGHRIDLGQIEVTLQSHPNVELAVVQKQKDGPLVAYFQGSAAPSLATDLNGLVAQNLPAYISIADYRLLDRWPRTPSGKIDRRALATASWVSLRPESIAVAQWSSDTERRLAQLFVTLVGQSILSDQTFFDAGANSLDLMRLQRAIAEQWPVTVSIADLFTYVTVRQLAGCIDSRNPVIGSDARAYQRLSKQAPIAIIGMAASIPGAADLDAMIQMIRTNGTGITHFTTDRPGYVGARSQMAQMMDFDPAYFDLSEAEAKVMDPQQRQILMNTVQALHNAGINPEMTNDRIGIIASAAENTYFQQITSADPRIELPDSYQLALHHEKDFLATKVAFRTGLTGPAMTVQTACSSGLVAVHVAADMLRNGDADVMLVSAALVDQTLGNGYRYRPFHIFSQDGFCRPFDAEASGTIGASGVSTVVLKPYAQAKADGDRVFAVIEGSALNNDGATKMSFAAPSVSGQSSVIRAAFAAAGVTGADIGYVEAHGTGTSLGDSIEVAALTNAYGAVPHKIALASLKSQIGHMGAAAGLAGLVRAALGLAGGYLPPNLHFQKANTKIDLAATPFRISPISAPWPATLPRRAGVSSFGIGGTNAHVIVAADPSDPTENRFDHRCDVITLSAHTATALSETRRRVAAFLRRNPASFGETQRHLQATDRQLPWRFAAVCADVHAAVTALENDAAPQSAAPVTRLKTKASDLTAAAIVKAWNAGARMIWGHTRAAPPDGFPTVVFDLATYDLLPQSSTATFPKRVPQSQWLSQWAWQRKRALPDAKQLDRTVVVVSRSALTAAARTTLMQGYSRIVTLICGPADGLTTPDHHVLARVEKADIAAALDIAAISGFFDVLYTLPLSPLPADSEERIRRAQASCLDYVAELSLALAGRDCRLFLISSFAAGVAEIINPELGLLAGPLAVVPQELALPVMWVDLETTHVEHAVADILRLLALPIHLHGRIMLRAGYAWVAAPTQCDIAETAPLIAGTHLVVGGTGGIGRSLARGILETSGTQIVLLSRNGKAVPDSLLGFADRVQVLRGDIGDPAEWPRLLRELQCIAPNLVGIVHAAGRGAGATLQTRRAGFMHTEMRSKTLGLLFIEKVIAAQQPSYVAYASSMSAILGGVGQFDYAAANGMMDSFAQRSATSGSTTRRMSINWDIWRESGMAVQALAQNALHQAHLAVGLTDAEGISVFRQAMTLGLPQVLVSTVPFSKADAFYAPLAKAPVAPRNAETPAAASEPTVLAIIKRLLGVNSVVLTDRLDEIGMDSLLLIDVAEEVQDRYGTKLDIGALGPEATIGDVLSQLGLAEPTPSETTLNKPVQEADQNLKIWRRGNTDKVIVLLHPVTGDVLAYHPLAEAMVGNVTICAISDPGLLDNAHSPTTVAAKAALYLQVLRHKFAGQNWHMSLVGWSFGALVAAEMATLMEEDQESAVALFLIDPPLSTGASTHLAPTEAQIAQVFRFELAPHPAQPLSAGQAEYLDRLTQCCRANIMAIQGWQPRALRSTTTHLFIALRRVASDLFAQPDAKRMIAQWQSLANGNLRHHQMDEDHFTIASGRAAAQIGQIVVQSQSSGV